MTPIYQTSTFVQQSPGVHKGWDYTRGGNPYKRCPRRIFCSFRRRKIRFSIFFRFSGSPSGYTNLNPKDHVLVCDDVYGGTGRLFRKLFAKYGIDFDFVDMTNESTLESKLNQKQLHLGRESNESSAKSYRY